MQPWEPRFGVLLTFSVKVLESSHTSVCVAACKEYMYGSPQSDTLIHKDKQYDPRRDSQTHARATAAATRATRLQSNVWAAATRPGRPYGCSPVTHALGGHVSSMSSFEPLSRLCNADLQADHVDDAQASALLLPCRQQQHINHDQMRLHPKRSGACTVAIKVVWYQRRAVYTHPTIFQLLSEFW
jgi:hypothetical protein